MWFIQQDQREKIWAFYINIVHLMCVYQHQPTLPYQSTQRYIAEEQMSDIDTRRQIWHLVAPIDREGLLGGGVGWEGEGSVTFLEYFPNFQSLKN